MNSVTMPTSEQIDNLTMSIRVASKTALNVTETAWFIGVCEEKVRVLAREKKIKATKTGQKLYFSKSDIERYLLQSEAEETDFEAEKYNLKHK